jgi:predicted anti-sigma-YlaC factor YlaD
MDHQPFENWLLDDEKLTATQRRELETHLAACPDCKKVHRGWKEVAVLIQTVAMVSPQPGFSLRWKANLAKQKMLQQPRQVRLFFLSLLGIAVFFFALLTGLLVAFHISLADLVVGAAKAVSGLFSVWFSAQTFINANLAGPVPLILWILFSTGVCLLIAVWIAAIVRISRRGVRKNETNS